MTTTTYALALAREVLGPTVGPDFPNAECRARPDVNFYPSRGGDVRPAKEVCRTCPHLIECREYALAHREWFGVWGGMSEREREKALKARRGGAG